MSALSVNCPRCSTRHASLVDDERHELSKCFKIRPGQAQNLQNDIQYLWFTVANTGNPADTAGDLQKADQLLKAMEDLPPEYNGRPVSRYMLEDAYRRVFPAKSGNNEAERQLQELARRGNKPPAAPISSHRRPTGRGQDVPIRGDSSRATASNASGAPAMMSGLVHEPNEHPQPKPTPQYQYAVNTSLALDDTLQQQLISAGQSSTGETYINVAANYVVVTSVPVKLHVYSITYGNITAVKTAKQKQEDQQAQATAKKHDMDASGANATLSVGQQSENRRVDQRSEKSRIFKSPKIAKTLDAVRFATDYETLWTLEALTPGDSGETIITNIEYSKLSGRRYRLDHITFTYCRNLQLSSDQVEAARSLINQVEGDATKKQASARITALNGLISHHVSSRSEDLVAVGPNKFFLKRGYQRAGLLDIHRGYFTSVRPGSRNVLLNVNTATAAFYHPEQVSKFLKTAESEFRDYGDAKGLLKGLTVRIRHQRKKHDPDYDPNTEDHRRRVIVEFGKKPSDQMFFLPGNPPTQKSVLSYFQDDLRLPIGDKDLECVNVGAKRKPQKPSKIGREGLKDGKGKGKAKAEQKDDSEVHRSPEIWVPPEYLHLEPYQPFKKLLLGHHTERMIAMAIRHPAANQNLIVTEGFEHLGIGQPNNGFDRLDISVGNRLLQVPARLLNAPTIGYRGTAANSRFKAADVSQASWNLVGARFYQEPQITKKPVYPLPQEVCTLDLRTGARSDEEKSIGGVLATQLQTHGIRFRESVTKHVFQSLSQEEVYLGDVDFHDLVKAKIMEMKEPKLILVLLSTRNIELYGKIKRISDQWLGVHTVCLTTEKLWGRPSSRDTRRQGPVYNGPRPQLLSNLALKFNIKLRGQNHQVCRTDTHVSAFSDIAGDTIVLGADVTHPAGGMPFCPSIAAVVASDDVNFANFPGSMRLQACNREIIEELETMVHERLMRFAEFRKFLPERMIFYRDGVSEDQFEQCVTIEIPQIRHAFIRATADAMGKVKGFKPHSDPLKLAFIVCGKRHHTRFYATANDQSYEDHRGNRTLSGDKKLLTDRRGRAIKGQYGNEQRPFIILNGNLQPGLLVDEIITRPKVGKGIYDFFLQSHAALHGTARSAHYSVLTEEGFNKAELQALMHAFCYNYQRATKGVSYAAPAYYADRLCDRGSHYLKGSTARQIEPPFQMSAEQKAMENKADAIQAYAADIADAIAGSLDWNPRIADTGEHKDRKNPWHPDFDDRMFWL